MEGFSKNYIRKKEEVQIKDRYDKQVEASMKKNQQMEARAFTQFAGKKQALQFIKRSYLIVVLGLLVSGVSYPLAVRFVKRVLGFKSFFNINFAAFPIVLNINALVLGTAQGLYNNQELSENYKIKSKGSYL